MNGLSILQLKTVKRSNSKWGRKALIKNHHTGPYNWKRLNSYEKIYGKAARLSEFLSKFEIFLKTHTKNGPLKTTNEFVSLLGYTFKYIQKVPQSLIIVRADTNCTKILFGTSFHKNF